MINIQIDEKKMKEMLSEVFKENITKILEDSILEYWVRTQVHRLLSKELIDKALAPMMTEENKTKLLKEAFDKYVEDKLKD